MTQHETRPARFQADRRWVPGTVLRLGTRGSALARIQAALVADLLSACTGAPVELVTVVTAGDIRRPDTTWGEGAFVAALETELRMGAIDVAVHSAKDVPIEPETHLVTGAYPLRADPRDALVTRSCESRSLDALPPGAIVGTDSPRRTGFLLAARPDLRVVPLHGNVDTRLGRLDRGEVDALVLAVAGLSRLGRVDRIDMPLPPELVPPAPGQGALAVQVRRTDLALREALRGLDDPAVRLAVQVERAVLEGHGGGCRAPLGALAAVEGGPDQRHVRLLTGVVRITGEQRRLETRTLARDGASTAAAALGRSLRDDRLPAGSGWIA